MSQDANAPRGRVLVAGAGGFLGRAVVRALVAGGYPARGLVRRVEQTADVQRVGGEPFLGDVADPAGVLDAMRGCAAAIHVAAAHPESPAEFERARQVRVEGARNLASAARKVGAHRLVIGSGYWVYADHPGPLTEDSPLDPRGESRINREAELAALASSGPGPLDVMIVRPGMVYGDGSWFRGMVDSMRAETYRIPGAGENYWSLVDLDDTAEGFRVVLERGQAGAAYLVADDHPIRVGELATLLSSHLGLPPPERVDLDALRQGAGDDVAHHLVANRAVSNRRLRSLGWSPRHPDCRAALATVLRSMDPTPRP